MVVSQFPMHFLVNLTDGIAIGHLEVDKILRSGSEAVFELFDVLFQMVIFDEQRILYIELLDNLLFELVDPFCHLRSPHFPEPNGLDLLAIEKM